MPPLFPCNLSQNLKSRLGKTALALVLSLVVLSPVPTVAQGITGAAPAAETSGQVRAMYDRLRRLEETLDTLQRAVYAGTPAPAPQVVAPAPSAPVAPSAVLGEPSVLATGETELLYDRVQVLENELRVLTGHYEVLDHQLDVANKRLERLVVDLDFRLRTIEDTQRRLQEGSTETTPQVSSASQIGGIDNTPVTPSAITDAQGTQGTAPGAPQVLGTVPQSEVDKTVEGAAPGPQVAEAESGLLPDGTVEERYQAALQYVLQQKLVTAEEAFDEFLAAHPNDTLASNAYYWKAESIYGRKEFERAAVVFLSGYQAFPEGQKAPDMLLKLSRSLSQIGEATEACSILVELRTAFPDLKGAIQRRADQDFEKLSCEAAVGQ